MNQAGSTRRRADTCSDAAQSSWWSHNARLAYRLASLQVSALLRVNWPGLIERSGRNGSQWWFRTFCKRQYASAVSDEHFLTCHRLIVTRLDAAIRLGCAVEVYDEGGYWESRDEQPLLDECAKSNRLIAHVAGQFTDAMRDAGLDSRELQAEIFKHPDFERLEMGDDQHRR